MLAQYFIVILNYLIPNFIIPQEGKTIELATNISWMDGTSVIDDGIPIVIKGITDGPPYMYVICWRFLTVDVSIEEPCRRSCDNLYFRGRFKILYLFPGVISSQGSMNLSFLQG